ncbi:LLM class flavin-dependent oxidoreductase [Sphingobacterium sp.]|uniref:LLM class flavin-dependent oxidoreductase n=1 Tax=Sphingobacterium sp. TaxID=341027 RepID=UPI0031E0FA34
MKIGILEFGDIEGNSTIAKLADGVISYAKKAERLGFNRFWLSEHHPRSLIWSNPLLFIALLCSQTDHILMGPGGILSAFHSPYAVFDYIRQLSILFPGRIDLGFAKGNPALNIQKLLLNQDVILNGKAEDLYERNIKKVCELIREESTIENIIPIKFEVPETWILTSSTKRLELALETGCNICLSTFHSHFENESIKEDIKLFKTKFYEKHRKKPKVALAIAGIVNSSEDRALTRFEKITNNKHIESSPLFVGNNSMLESVLKKWNSELDIDEFLFKDMEFDNNKRLKTLSLISEIL